MFIIVALLALIVLASLLVTAGVWSARVTAKALGLRPFRWFDAGPPEDPGKRFIVRAVSSLSGLAVAIVLAILTHVVEGKPVPSLEIRVRSGQPAANAGLLEGDRIITVDGKPVTSSDEVRAAVAAPGDVKQIEVERQGSRRRFSVTPEDGRIGVEFIEKREAFSPGEALSGGLAAPFMLWTHAIRTVLFGSEAQLAGPVGIVRSADDRSGSLSGMFRVFAMLASLYWPALAGVHLYAAVTRVLFARTYPGPLHPETDRTAVCFRLYQALAISLGCLVVAVVAHLAMDLAGLDAAGFVILLVAPATASIYPLVWSLDQTLTARPSYFRSTVLILPCVAPFAAIALLLQSRKHLRNAGFPNGHLTPTP